jgi:hypothetical protein
MAIMAATVQDWGEVTDVRLIRKRLNDINELRSLTTQIDDAADEIVDAMLQGRVSKNTDYSQSNGYSGNLREPIYMERSRGTVQPTREQNAPFDLWGETPSTSNPRRSSSLPASTPKKGGNRGYWDPSIGIQKIKEEFDSFFDEETLEEYGEVKKRETESQSPWRNDYEKRRNPQAKKY